MKSRFFSKIAFAAACGVAWLSAGIAAAGPLQEIVQAKLDSNPYLAQQEIKIRVVQEDQGSVTIELTNGPKILRDLFRKGIELDGAGMRDASLKSEDLKSLGCIRKAVQAVKQIKGVRDISLTGSINPLDPAENDYILACQQMAQGNSAEREEAVQILKRSAQAGFPAAQCELAGYYIAGDNMTPSDENALYWYRKAAAQGEPRAQYNLGRMLASGRGTAKNYPEAIQWYENAAAQSRLSLVKIRSLNALALLLATCPQEGLRDGNKAAEFVAQAEKLDSQNPALFEVRAAVHAACGQFAEAAQQQKYWIEHLEHSTHMTLSEKEARLSNAKKRLELFQNRRVDAESETAPEEDK